jgi:long-chain acyl-CoA synthetase
VEGVFNQHPAVSQSAVVGRAVPGNEEVVAFVELRPGASLSAEALREFVAERLSPYKQPAEIIVLPALPASSTGKVLKNELRKMAEARGGP